MTLTPMPNDNGGNILAYGLKIRRASGPKLLPLVCKSAGTMWLGYEKAFVLPQARFGFHRVRRDPTGIMKRVYMSHLKKAHPDLKQWFERYADDRDHLVWMTGQELIVRGWAREYKA